MLGLGPPLVELAGFSLYAIVGSVALSVAQAWAVDTTPSTPLRQMLAWAVCTGALALPVFVFLGFPGNFAFAHANVGGTAILLGALTAGAAFEFARRRRPEVLPGLTFSARVTCLFPIHLATVIILGAADILILAIVFLGNIH